MRIKKKNIARLASISALGAGALGVAAGTAQASIINITPIPGSVGFTGGAAARWTGVAAGSPASFAGRHIAITANQSTSGMYQRLNIKVTGAGITFLLHQGIGTKHGLATGGPFLELVTGKNFNSAFVNTQVGSKANIEIQRLLTHTLGGTNLVRTGAGVNYGKFADQYALFRFGAAVPGGYDYGWLELSGQNPSVTGGPQVSIEGGQYDNTGALVTAPFSNCGSGGNDEGEGGGGCVPEPSTMVMFGFAALAWGATGLRRWRAARKPAA